MRSCMIVFKKQLKDTIKNKTILIQFILFPIMTLVMENAISMENMPELFFTKLFSVMYMGMAPLVSVASIISEEKEKNTLRVLMMANVQPGEYLTGVGAYVWVLCMLGACFMATGIQREKIITYLCFMGIGFVISIIAGACIGIYAKNQMSATSLVMPAMMLLSFAPMLAMFNDTIARFAKLFYTQQIKLWMETLSWDSITGKSCLVIIVNVVLLLTVFTAVYKRKGLE